MLEVRAIFRKGVLGGVLLIMAALLTVVGCVASEPVSPDNPPNTPEVPQHPDKTFYVVAYHFGWAIYEADGTRLNEIRVKAGTTLEIYAVNYLAGSAIAKLPVAVSGAIKELRAPGREAIAGFEPLYHGQDPGDHGFLIHLYGVVELLDDDAPEPVRVVFAAKYPGSYQFVCSEYCGPGHPGMSREMLFVE